MLVLRHGAMSWWRALFGVEGADSVRPAYCPLLRCVCRCVVDVALCPLLRLDRVLMLCAAAVLAFEYMHSKDIIYRDLKPENLLLDHQGHLKITDFGFAKICKTRSASCCLHRMWILLPKFTTNPDMMPLDRTWTLCGTPDYLAPEVVSGAGHGKPVDWWTLGIFIFEMLARSATCIVYFSALQIHSVSCVSDGDVALFALQLSPLLR